MFAGLVILIAGLQDGAGAGVTTWPMLLAGLGMGALASQLGAITVSSVSDEQSGEVGGLQNTVTNLGISIGTALTGAIVIAALSSSFLTGVEANPAVPDRVQSQAQTKLAGGVPFLSDAELETALGEAHVLAAGDHGDRRRKRKLAAGRPSHRAGRAGDLRPDRALLHRHDPRPATHRGPKPEPSLSG